MKLLNVDTSNLISDETRLALADLGVSGERFVPDDLDQDDILPHFKRIAAIQNSVPIAEDESVIPQKWDDDEMHFDQEVR